MPWLNVNENVLPEYDWDALYVEPSFITSGHAPWKAAYQFDKVFSTSPITSLVINSYLESFVWT